MAYTIPNLSRLYTVSELLELPEPEPPIIGYELFDGVLHMKAAPAMLHQRVITRLSPILFNYMNGLGLSDTYFSVSGDISWHERQLFLPDMLVLHPSELHHTDWLKVQRLVLVVEVLSPSTALIDRNKKRPVYQQYGVETLWLVDPRHQHVEVWHPTDSAPTIVTDTLTWQHPNASSPLSIDLAGIFAPPGERPAA